MERDSQRVSEAAYERDAFGRAMDTITFEDFLKVDVRVGRVLEAAESTKARKPAYRLRVDFGPKLGVKTSSAQVTDHYTPEQLVGRQVLAVVNFPPRQVADVRSEVLVLGVVLEDESVVLVRPDREVPVGVRFL
jgi:tRNA-binding protein